MTKTDREAKKRRDADRRARWNAAAAVRSLWSAEQLQAEDDRLAEEIADRVERGQVQRTKPASPPPKSDGELSGLIRTWTVTE